MSNFKYFAILLLIAVFSLGAASAMSQTAPTRGIVKLQKADGTQVPVADAVVDVYQTDISKGSMPSTKTNKRGEFTFINLLLGKTYAIAISAPGVSPRVQPNVKAGQEDIVIVTNEGDGRRVSEDELRSFVAGKGGVGNTQVATSGAKSKEQEELEKKNAAITAKNEEIKNKNAVIQKAFEEGNAAINAKDYSTAITKYTEGINADPEFAGSAPILLNNRAIAYRYRAIDEYNGSVKAADPEKSAGIAKAKDDFLASLDSYNKSLAIIKNAAPADLGPASEKAKYDALAGRIETHRLLVSTKTDVTKADEAKQAFDEYLAVEPDAAKKAKAELTYADVMRELGDSEKAIAGYRSVLQSSPNNVDALAGLGLSLFNQGVISNDKAMLQEGLDYMQKFADTAPDTHPLKASVKDAVEYLKSQEKLTPQKVTTPKKKP